MELTGISTLKAMSWLILLPEKPTYLKTFTKTMRYHKKVAKRWFI